MRYFVGTNDMLVGLHVPTNLYIASLTLTLRKCMYSICERAERASLVKKNYILKLSLFCWYIRYFVMFVGTNDMLVGLHVPTNLFIASLTLYIKEMYV